MRKQNLYVNLTAFFAIISRYTIGSLLLLSALMHLSNPYDYLARVLEYQLVPETLAVLLAALIPFMQLVISTALLWKIAERGAWVLSLIMFATFTVAQLISLARGLQIDCGCFGYYSHSISPVSITLVAVCALVSAGCLLVHRFTMTLDSYVRRVGVKNETA